MPPRIYSIYQWFTRFAYDVGAIQQWRSQPERRGDQARHVISKYTKYVDVGVQTFRKNLDVVIEWPVTHDLPDLIIYPCKIYPSSFPLRLLVNGNFCKTSIGFGSRYPVVAFEIDFSCNWWKVRDENCNMWMNISMKTAEAYSIILSRSIFPIVRQPRNWCSQKSVGFWVWLKRS